MPGNARPGQPEGKRHREQTALHVRVRLKRWGKSPPRDGQPDRHGKPHREQCRIGTSRPAWAGPPWPGGPGWQLERFGNGPPRGMIVGVGATRRYKIRLTGRPRKFISRPCQKARADARTGFAPPRLRRAVAVAALALGSLWTAQVARFAGEASEGQVCPKSARSSVMRVARASRTSRGFGRGRWRDP